MDQRIVFELDYPSDDGALYANMNVASGWCFHPTERVHAIRLEVNGRFQSDGIIGYPRLDIAQRYGQHCDSALTSGFHCYFDAGSLVHGENRFTFQIRTTSSSAVFEKFMVLQATPARRYVSDVFIDIVGPCNLRCVMCPQGDLENRSAERGRGFMPVELFDRTITFLQERGFLNEYVNLYNWGDPLLHPHLGEILDLCQHRDIKPIVSTNLSFPTRILRRVTQHDVELLIVSISGFSAATYNQNHAHGDFTRVRRNLDALSEYRGRVRDVLVKYLAFRYNRHELEPARAFSRAAGFQFGAYAGAIPSAESFFRYRADAVYRAEADRFIEPSWMRPQPSRFCPQETSITINHRAELEQCCVSWGGARRASLFDTDLAQHLDRKLDNDLCRRCLATGYSYYKHFGVVIPELLALSLHRGQA